MTRFFQLVAFLVLPAFALAQDDLMKMMDSTSQSAPVSSEPVTGMFKTLKIISLQTPQTMGHGELDFRITHRFGNMGGDNGGVHTLYGFDQAEDIRYSLDYGLTRTLQVGIGRSKKMEAIDGSVKWRFLEQTLDEKIPITACLYSCASVTPVREAQFYSGADTGWVAANKSFAHRWNYFSQLIIARRFAPWFSVAVAPGFLHRNYVLGSINPANNSIDENSFFVMSGGIRIKISRSVSILADYFQSFSEYRRDNSVQSYYPALALGVEIETGGHIFHINLTNASGILENYLVANTTDSWGEGGFKFGFNISRAFTILNR